MKYTLNVGQIYEINSSNLKEKYSIQITNLLPILWYKNMIKKGFKMFVNFIAVKT